MTGVIGHPRQPPDDSGHAGQGPQVSAKAVRPRPLTQRPIDALQLLAVESRPAACPACTAKRGDPAAPPLSVPTADTLTAHLQPASDGRRDLADTEQARGSPASMFECWEVPARTHLGSHASIIHRTGACVTVLCETQ